jgi:hypothetical protein
MKLSVLVPGVAAVCALAWLAPVMAAGRADPRDSGSSSSGRAMISGFLICSDQESPHGVFLSLNGTLGVEGDFVEVGNGTTLACQEAFTRLALPSPLCAGATQLLPQFERRNLTFACSGPADDVVDAIGRLAKGILSLP